MSYCKKCGIKLDDDTVFCPNCGTPVAKTKKPASSGQQTPPATGQENPSGTMANPGNLYGRADPDNLPEGYVIDERYKIIEKLGQGSFGAVYLAYDLQLEINKALKIIPEAVVRDKEAMLSLRKEAAIMVKLNHPNIVRVYDFHHTGGMKYIDMEYVEGKSLADLKLEKPGKKFTEKETKLYALQIAEGLSYAHRKKVIHKDIKPQNIMLSGEGEVKIMDFGIAETVHSSMSRLKNTGTSGTLVYMSPEQLRGKDVGKESDIYSLGATLYELLTGNPPFYQGDITYQIINETPAPVASISKEMNAIILKCLEKDQKQRFADCEELMEAFQTGKIPESSAKTPVQPREQKPAQKETKVPPATGNNSNNRNNNKRLLYYGMAALFVALALLFYLLSGRHSSQILTVTSYPSDALLTLDGQSKGKTPVTLQLKQSTHHLVLSKANFFDTLVTFNCNDTSPRQINIVLKPRVKNLAVLSWPSGALLTLDGKKAGATPATLYVLKGVHRLLLQKQPLYSDTLTTFVMGNTGHKLNFRLRQKAKYVSVTSVPSGAQLSVDGQDKGVTPVRLPLDFGKHTFALQKAGYINKTSTFTITKTTPAIKVALLKKVTVTSVPSGARLTVDGMYKGITPVTVELSLEKHDFTLEKKPLYKVTRSVVVSTTTGHLQIKLNQTATNVTVTSVPSGARLTVDGVLKGITPVTTTLSLGKHNFRFIKKWMTVTSISREVTVHTQNIHIPLKPIITMYRANVQRTGFYPGKGVPVFHQVKWKFETGDTIFSSPAVSGGTVYVGSFDHYLYALDAATGQLKWKFKTGYFVFSSPAVSGGTVYVGSADYYVYALDAATGQLKWKFKTGYRVGSSPAVSGGTVYVGSGDGYVYALDAATGQLKWKFKTGSEVLSSPSVNGGTVYVGSWDRYVYALDAATGQLKWKFKTGSVVFSSPAVAGGTVYVGSFDHYVYALDAATGQLKWKFKTGDKIGSSPAVAGGIVYVGSFDDSVYALDAATGQLKWKFKTRDLVASSPVVSGGTVYVGSWDDYVYALDAATGQLKWKFKTGSVVFSSPAVTGGTVYVGSYDHYVYALE